MIKRILVLICILPCIFLAACGNAESQQYLSISGAGISGEVSFTVDELKSLPGTFEGEFFALNNYGTKAYYRFEGIRLASLLGAALILPEASRLRIIAGDGYECEMSITDAIREDYIDEQNPGARYPVIIAWKENGEEYDPSDGLPFRLVIGQRQAGDINKPNWVSNVAMIVVER